MTTEVPKKNRHQFGSALALILIGLLAWFLGMAVGLGAGSSATSSDHGLVLIALASFYAGPIIVVVGVIWLLVILIRRFLA